MGIVVESVSGALAATNQDFDVFAAVFIGAITSLGGGTIRDVLLGHYPLLWIGRPHLLVMALCAGVITIVIGKHLLKVSKIIITLDALGLAAFTIVSTERLIQAGVNPLITVIMAMITAIAGGIMRDLLCNRTPLVFREELYAVVAIVTSGLYQILHYWDLEFFGFELIVLVSGFSVRMFAVRYRIGLPRWVISH